jgi:Rieske Fe-S protein
MSEHDLQQTCSDAVCGGCGASEGINGTVIDRRAFLMRSAFAAAAVALAACGGAAGDAMAPSSVSASVKVSDYPALSSVGGVALITAGGSPLAVVRTGTSSFVALSRICPHQGAIVNTSASGFTCPRHGAQFGATGSWRGGQRTSNLRSYPTSYDDSTATLTIG